VLSNVYRSIPENTLRYMVFARLYNTCFLHTLERLVPSGAITFYEGNNMLSALAKYVINRLIHDLFHIALVISPRLISSLGAVLSNRYLSIPEDILRYIVFARLYNTCFLHTLERLVRGYKLSRFCTLPR
jgi:hypothetical protein